MLLLMYYLALLQKIIRIKSVLLSYVLDLKKTFDFINHDLLLVKLKHCGIRGLPLFWLYSYLSNRTQKVKVNYSFSNSQFILVGVPEGSILSSLLFNIFINDIFQFSSPHCEIHLYADDAAVIISADNMN